MYMDGLSAYVPLLERLADSHVAIARYRSRAKRDVATLHCGLRQGIVEIGESLDALDDDVRARRGPGALQAPQQSVRNRASDVRPGDIRDLERRRVAVARQVVVRRALGDDGHALRDVRHREVAEDCTVCSTFSIHQTALVFSAHRRS